MTLYEALRPIAAASRYHNGYLDAAVSEGLDLLRALRRHCAYGGDLIKRDAVLNARLVDWKRGRGMLSSGEMSKERRRQQWLAFAHSICDLALALGPKE